jgi:hypothetical protein
MLFEVCECEWDANASMALQQLPSRAPAAKLKA